MSDDAFILETVIELRDRMLGVEGRLGELEDLVDGLYVMLQNTSDKPSLPARVTALEHDYHGIITYFFANANPRTCENVPRKLQEIDDAVNALGPWIKDLYDKANAAGKTD